MVFHCIVCYCIVLYCIWLYCMVLHGIALHCIVLYGIVFDYILWYCMVFHCFAWYCIDYTTRCCAVNLARRWTTAQCIKSFADLIFVAGRRARPVEKNLPCGEISNFCTWNMWRKLKFLHMWIYFKFLHMTDAEKSEISFVVCTIYGILLHFTLFCCKICIFFGVLRCFVAKSVFVIYALLCGEKFSQK